MKRRVGLIVVAVLVVTGAFLGWTGIRRRVPIASQPPVVQAERADEFTASLAGRPLDSRTGPKREEDAPPRPPGELRTVRVGGVCFDENGGTLPLRVRVTVSGCYDRGTHTFDAGSNGEFGGVIEVPRACREIVFVGRSAVDDNAVLTFPERRPLDDEVVDVRVLLVARRGALVRGAVAAADDIGGTRVLVSQIALGDDRPFYDWNSAGLGPIDEFHSLDAAGRFSVVVRPGLFRVRVVAASGAVGRLVTGTARAGGVYELGLLESPSDAAPTTIQVIDEAGRVVSGASVQFGDREIHLCSPVGLGDLPQFKSDREGLVRLPPLARSVFPIHAAATADGYDITAFEVHADPQTTVRLRQQRRVLVRLTGPGALGLVDSLPAVKLMWQEREPAPGEPGVPPPEEVLLETKSKRLQGVTNETERALWIEAPPPGSYALLARLGPTLIGGADVVIPPPPEVLAPAEIEVVQGRLVKVSLDLPKSLHPTITRHQLRVTLTASDLGEQSLSLPAGDLLDTAPEAALLWVPTPFDGIRVSSANECLLPIPDQHQALHGDTARVRLRELPDTGDLVVSFRAPDGQSPHTPWPVILVPINSDSTCNPGIVAFLTDVDGKAHLRLREGPYEIRTDRGFVAPYVSARTRVVRGETTDLVVPLSR